MGEVSLSVLARIPSPEVANGRVVFTGHDEVALADPARVLLLKKGYLTIYLVRLENGAPTGRRRYLFTCNEGSLVYGCSQTMGAATYALLAVAVEECECEAVDAAALGTKTSHFLGAQHWCDHLCRLLAEETPSAFAERANADGTFIVDPPHRVRPNHPGLGTLVVESGQLTLFGLTSARVNGGDPPLLLMSETWLVCEQKTVGRFVPVSPTAQTNLAPALLRIVSLALPALLEISQREESAEKVRLLRVNELQNKVEAEAIRHLAITGESTKAATTRGTPLQMCLDAISKESGIAIDTSSLLKPNQPVLQQLATIIRASGSRHRKVRLLDDWWEADGGSILAFRKADSAPVAVLSVSQWGGLSRHYEVFDPTANTRERLTPSIAEALAADGYVFLRPLPNADGTVNFWNLSKFTFAPFIPDIRLSLGLALVSGIIGAAMPIANRLMIDNVIPDANRRLLYDLSIGLGAMSLGLFLFNLAQGLVSLRVKTGLTAHLQAAVIDRLLRLPARFFRKYDSGDLLNRAMMITEISGSFSMTALSAIFSLFSTIVMLGLCFYYSQKLAFLALISAVITTLVSIAFSFPIRTRALQLELRQGKLFGLIVQMIHGVSKLQIAGAEVRAFNQWARLFGEDLRMQYEISKWMHYSGMCNTVIQTLSTVALYYFAGVMVASSQEFKALSPTAAPLMTIGTFFAIQATFAAVGSGVATFFSTFLNVYQQTEKRKLVRPILEEPIEGGGGRIDPGRLDGHLQVKNISFRYVSNGPLILKNVDLHAYPGEFIAVVGPSGSGKSTLLKLLLGFESPESGQILFDKKDSKDLDMIAIRRQIGVVLQDGKVNAGTIFHNIAGACQLSLDDAWEAANLAGMKEDIEAMPMGIHTLVPEGGTTLSGGQRQRLLIARALAIKPRIMFFDEATSALDNHTQEIVTQSLNQRRITRIIIAHRLSTIINADRIYVMDQGAVVQEGTAQELMNQEGIFKRLSKSQTT